MDIDIIDVCRLEDPFEEKRYKHLESLEIQLFVGSMLSELVDNMVDNVEIKNAHDMMNRSLTQRSPVDDDSAGNESGLGNEMAQESVQHSRFQAPSLKAEEIPKHVREHFSIPIPYSCFSLIFYVTFPL